MKYLVTICLSILIFECAFAQDFDGFDGFDASSFSNANFGGEDLSGFDSGSFDGFADGGGSFGGASEFDGASDFNLGQFGLGESARFEGDAGSFHGFQKK
ncbi:hypothetical protein TNCT_132751 [Trichonephila clavata]|uniref:Uncharacterized protein n=1 Tax=Trichonephila clavata TaxID=2740835 RepID=A0A8X6IK46_TRICU|nr:hypothetical protein TNCT_132751 [Trichonephila clavata]